jgi:protein-tyrosine phosphatase
MFDDLKQNKSLLLHCTAGKDRTGVGSALILLALGVPRATVIADYQLTNQFQAPASVLANHPELAGIPALKEAKPDYINAALDGIDAEYGNLDNYFAIELKLSAADRTQLRNFYLTPTTH